MDRLCAPSSLAILGHVRRPHPARQGTKSLNSRARVHLLRYYGTISLTQCWGARSGSHVFGPPVSISQEVWIRIRIVPFIIKMMSRLKDCLQHKILTQNFCKNLIFKTEENVPVGKL